VEFRFRVTAQENTELQLDSVAFSNIKRAQATLNSPDQTEVTVYTASEQHTTTQTNNHRTIARMSGCMKAERIDDAALTP
jgi:hypothetical protein